MHHWAAPTTFRPPFAMNRSSLKFLVMFGCVLTVLQAGAKLQRPEETLALFDQHRLTIAVPDGFSYQVNHADSGVAQVKMAGAASQVNLDIVFIPDPDEQFKNARSRRELLNDEFNEFVEHSTEHAMQFEELAPRTGTGTYCVFTDTKLVGKTEMPAGEYLHLTAGVKAWPGVVAVFRLFSNDTKSADYQAAMKMLRESVQEKPVPLR